jgi:hypothetical protein
LIKFNILIITILCLTACTKSSTPTTASPVALSEAEIIKQANVDFEAVLKGQSPIHAKMRDVALADGGTTFYQGHGYSLEVRKRLSDSDKEGFAYGPIIEFENIKENGQPKKMSSVKFYTIEEMQKLLNTNR